MFGNDGLRLNILRGEIFPLFGVELLDCICRSSGITVVIDRRVKVVAMCDLYLLSVMFW